MKARIDFFSYLCTLLFLMSLGVTKTDIDNKNNKKAKQCQN